MRTTCDCGCGEPTAISRVTVSARGWKKGEPKRYVQGHHAKPPERIERIECACGCGEVIEWTYRHRERRPLRVPGHVTPALRAKYEASRTQAEPNPSGLCQCGCGERTPISRWTNKRSGAVRGKSARFVSQHQLRGVKRGEGRYVNGQGYVLLRMPDHPRAHKGYVLEHRWVGEQMLGRPLQPSETVHHMNHDRTDNRPENLIVLSRHDHGLLHGHPIGMPLTLEHRAKLSESGTRAWVDRKKP